MMIAHWVEAARPKTIPASLSPILLATALAYPYFNFAIFFCVALSGISLQIGANLANDYFDFKKGADTPLRKGPRRMLQSSLISPKSMRRALIITFTFTTLSTLYLIYSGGILFFFLLALGIFLAVGYTAKPLSIAYRGLGELTVFLVFGPLALSATYFLQVGHLESRVFLASLIPGLYSAAIMLVNNIRDQEEDSRTGKKTLAVIWGKDFCKKLYASSICFASLTPLLFSGMVKISSLTFLLTLPLINQLKEENEMNELLAKTGKLLLFQTLLFSALWIVSHTV